MKNNKTEKLEDSESSPVPEQNENSIDSASHFMF